MEETSLQSVDIWRLAFATAPDDPSADAVLSADERSRAATFRFPSDRRRFVLSRAFLREVLSRYRSLSPDRIAFSIGRHGKPGLADLDDNLRFNLSHSAGGCLVAVTEGADVGVDGEERRTLTDLNLMMRGTLTAEETAALLAAPERERHDLFLRYWTRKEAVLKAASLGLTEPPDRVAVPAGPARNAIVVLAPQGGNVARYRLHDISRGDMIAAVAVGIDEPVAIQEPSP